MLLVGPTTSGKTLFSKQLQEYLSNGSVLPEANIQPTIPTVGTNITTLQISRKEAVEIRELGGSMAPIWKKYYKNTEAVLFVADKSNPQQLSADCILLLEMLANEELRSVPFLIIWNKIDRENCMTDGFIKNVLNLEMIGGMTTQRIDTMDCSCLTGEGFKFIISWLQNIRSS